MLRSVLCSGLVGVALGLGPQASVSLAVPPNDACLSAGGDPVPGFGGSVSGTVVDATSDGGGCGRTLGSGRDVYHSFVPGTSGPWRLDLCTSVTEWDTVLSIHLHPSDPSALACPTGPANRVAGGCDDDSCFFFGQQTLSSIRAVSLEAGVLYTIRVAGFDGGSTLDAYTLTVTDLALANDSCSGADQSPIPGSGGTVTGDANNATTDGQAGSICVGGGRATTARDLYHAFTPDTTGRWTFSTCGFGTFFDTVVSIHSGCPATAANQIACNNDGCEDLAGLSVVSAQLNAGVTYVVRVAELLSDPYEPLLGDPQYTLTVSGEVIGRCCSNTLGVCQVLEQSQCGPGNTFTPNESCAPLTFGSNGSCPAGSYNSCANAVVLEQDVAVLASTSGLTGTALARCTDLTADCWFQFTAPAAGTYQLTLTPFSLVALIASMTNGAACPASAGGEFDCGRAGPEGLKFALAANASVKIRVASNTAARFTAVVALAATEPPANDLCGSATALTRNSTVTGTFDGATGGLDVVTCGVGGRDVWYTYTPSSTTRTRVVVTPDAGSSLTTGVSVSTTCGNATTPIACASDPFTLEQATDLTFSATVGVTYRIRVATSFEGGGFTIRVSNAPTAPTNDACASATTLNLNQSRTGTTAFALGTGTAIGDSCMDRDQPDVWYRVRSTSAGTYDITTTPSSMDEPSTAIEVYAACPSAGADPIACAGNIGPGSANTLLFLAAANTDYFVRVAALAGDGADFSVIATQSVTAIGACCVPGGGCTLTTPDSCASLLGTYRGDGAACATAGCDPVGRCCFVGSSECAISSQSACSGPGATFTPNGTCGTTPCPAGTTPANDLCANAPTLSLPASVLGANDLANSEGSSIPPGFCGPAEALDLGLNRSVYYRFVAPFTGMLNVDPGLVNFPQPMLVLYRGSSCTGLVDVGCTVGFQAGERRSFSVEGGATYYLAVGFQLEADLGDRDGGLFQLSLSVSCAADFDADGSVSVPDLFGFLDAWFAQNGGGPGLPSADFDGDGTVTVVDLFAFLDAWFVQNGNC